MRSMRATALASLSLNPRSFFALDISGPLALSRLAPRRHGVTAAGSAAFAAAMRMVDRVHRNTAIVRTPSQPARAACLADRCIHVIGIRHRADRRKALAVDE